MSILIFGPKIFNVQAANPEHEWNIENGKHLTIYYNVFIFLQIFNLVGCRRIGIVMDNPF